MPTETRAERPSWAPVVACGGCPIESTADLVASGRLKLPSRRDAAGAYCEVFFGTYAHANGELQKIAAKRASGDGGGERMLRMQQRDMDAASRISSSPYVGSYLAVTTRLTSGGEVLPDYFIMPREGPTLHAWLTSGHWPTASQSKEERTANRAAFEKYLWCVLQGLSDLHDAGIVHRDIRPSNCVTSGSDSGHAKVIDLGLARPNLDRGAANNISNRLSDINGIYTAPEYTSLEEATFAVDVWAVGAMAAEWLYMEQHPIGGAAAWEALNRLWLSPHELAAAQHGTATTAPKDSLGALARLAMHADPAQRPTAAECAMLLAAVPVLVAEVTTTAATLLFASLFASMREIAALHPTLFGGVSPESARFPADREGMLRHVVSCCDTVLNGLECGHQRHPSITKFSRAALLRAVRQLLEAGPRLLPVASEEATQLRLALLSCLARMYALTGGPMNTAAAVEARTQEVELLAKMAPSRKRNHRLAQSLQAKAAALQVLGGTSNVTASISAYDHAIEILESAYGHNHVEVADALQNKAVAVAEIGGESNVAAAVVLFDRAIEILSASNGADHASLAGPLHNKANAMSSRGGSHLGHAVALYDRAIQISTNAHGERSAKTLKVIDGKASALRGLGGMANLRSAVSLFQRVIDGYTAEYGARHVEVARASQNKAGALAMIGGSANLHAAITDFNSAIRIFEDVYGPIHHDVASVLQNKAVTLKSLGEAAHLAEAIVLFDRAIAIRKAIFGRKHELVATTMSNKALVLEQLGGALNLNAAVALYDEAIDICTAALGRTHPHVAATMQNKALALHRLGGEKNYGLAIELFDRAIDIETATFGANHVELSVTLQNKAMTLESMGGDANLSAAIALHDRAIRIKTKALGPQHGSVAVSVRNKANAMLSQGGAENVATAMRLYDQALAICTAAYDPTHIEVAVSLQTKAGGLVTAGGPENNRTAIELYDRALGIMEKTYGPNHTHVGQTLHNKAGALRSLGDAGSLAAALPLYDRAIDIMKVACGPEHPTTRSMIANRTKAAFDYIMVSGDLGVDSLTALFNSVAPS